jgi:hypothetical protein
VQTPRDPILEPLVRRLGPWGFPIAGLVFSLVWEAVTLFILHRLGMTDRLLDRPDGAGRFSVGASIWLLDLAGPAIVWALYGWLRRSSPRLMLDLHRRRVFVDAAPAASPEGAAARSLWIAGVALALAGAVQQSLRPPGWNDASMFHAQLRLAVSIPLWYTLWMCIVTLGAVIGGLRREFGGRAVRLHAFHPDGVGGLGPLQAYIRTLMYFILAISALLAVAVAVATVTAQLSTTRIDRVLVVYVFGFVLVAPVGLLGTIWPAHAAMVRARARLETAVATLVAEQTARVHELPDPRLTTDDLDRFALSQRAHQFLSACPTWPVNPVGLRRVIVGIFSPLLIGVLIEVVVRFFLRR